MQSFQFRWSSFCCRLQYVNKNIKLLQLSEPLLWLLLIKFGKLMVAIHSIDYPKFHILTSARPKLKKCHLMALERNIIIIIFTNKWWEITWQTTKSDRTRKTQATLAIIFKLVECSTCYWLTCNGMILFISNNIRREKLQL